MGHGAVVAAGAVVFRDVGLDRIVSGNPAVKIGDKMPENQPAAPEYPVKYEEFMFSECGTCR